MSRKALISRFLIILVSAALIWGLGVMPYLAWRQWNAVRTALVAKGEKLSLADFPAPTLRDEENFFADPIWRELSDRKVVETNTGPVHAPRLPEGQWQLGVLKLKFSREELAALRKDFPEFGGQLTDEPQRGLHKIWEQTIKNPDQSSRAAEITLRALAPTEPILSRLRELSPRADAWFPLAYEDGLAMRFDHVTFLMYAGQRLEMRARAQLQLGDYRAAYQDTALIFRLVETLKRNALFLPYLVESSLTEMFTDSIDRGIRIHAWTADELRAFDRMLATLDAPKSRASALRMERAMMLDAGWSALGKNAKSPEPAPVAFLASLPLWFYRLAWMPGDKALYSEIMQKEVERLDAVPLQGMNPRFFSPNLVLDHLEKHNAYLEKTSKFVTMLALPGQIGGAFLAARTQTFINLTRTAIALELYRNERGEYPESLYVLKPGTPDGVPLDLITGRPFLYRRNEDGSFSLWSVGWNEKDEGGRIEKKPAEGDWVWGA